MAKFFEAFLHAMAKFFEVFLHAMAKSYAYQKVWSGVMW